MNATAYLNFPGNCAEAFQYYEKHLGAKPSMMMTHAQSPEPSPLEVVAVETDNNIPDNFDRSMALMPSSGVGILYACLQPA
jgi:uncharacterized glyoxalase superfamily protein PhnB